MDKQQIGSFVLTERKKQKLSQKDLAEKAGFSRYQQILEIEKAQFDYGVEVLSKVMKGLGLEIRFVPPDQSESSPSPPPDTGFFDFRKVEPAKEEILVSKKIKLRKKDKK